MPVCQLSIYLTAQHLTLNFTALGHDKAQSIIDQITSAYDSGGGPPPGGFNFGPPAGGGFGGPPPFGGFPGAGTPSFVPVLMIAFCSNVFPLQ